jgi:hypothetical protein
MARAGMKRIGRWAAGAVLGALVGASCSGGSDAERAGAGTGTPGSGGTAGGAAAEPGDPGPARAPGETIFAANSGDAGQQSLGGIAADAAGNTYVVGNEFPVGIVTFDPTTGQRVFGPTEGSANDAFVVKYDGAGSARWVQPFAPTGDSFANLTSVAVQPSTGAEILAGWVSGSVTVGSDTLTSGTNPLGFPARNLWLTALDSAGYVVWSRLFPSSFDAYPDQVFVTASGDIEVVGRSVDNATVGGGPLCCRNSQFGTNTFIARYGVKGDPIWSVVVTGEFNLFGSGADPAGDVVVGGSLTGTMGFAGESFTVTAPPPSSGLLQVDGVVLRLTPAGQKDWIKIYGGPDSASTAASLDAAGNVIVFGQFNGTLDLGNGRTLTATVTDPLQTTGFLAKLAPDGTAQWARAFPSNGFDNVTTQIVATDAAGNVAFGGTTAGGLDVGGGTPVLPAGSTGDVVAKYGPDGTFLWSRGFAVATSNDASRRIGLSFDGAGDLSFSGEFDNTVDFGTGPLTAPGQTHTGGSAFPKVPDNVFTTKLAP